MCTRCCAALVQMLGEADAVRIMIDSVKVLDCRPTTQVLGDDVGGEDGIDLPGYRPRVVSTLLVGSQRVRQTVLGQYALNRRLARRWLDTESFQFALNRSRPDQTVTRFGSSGFLQYLPHGD